VKHFSGSTVNIAGGDFSNSVDAHNGSIVNISGGIVSDRLRAFDGSTVNITGGVVGNDFTVRSGATANISGGTIGDAFTASVDSNVIIAGGFFGTQFYAVRDSNVDLFGIEFALSGVDITSSLVENVPFVLADRQGTLTGVLADGSPFSFDLNSTRIGSEDFFDPTANLRITLVGPGDFNGDGAVNGSDFLSWQRGNSPNPFTALDLENWQRNFGFRSEQTLSSTIVPEPETHAFAIIASILAYLFRRH